MSLLKNSLLGFIVGDAMGVPIEFKTRETLKNYPLTQMVGYGTYNEPVGTWSDDSSMTIATIESLIEKESIDYHDIATKFCEWVNCSKFTATDHLFDIGITTKYSLIRFFVDKIEATKCGGTNEYENGNGSLMRIMPIVLYSYYKNLNDDQLYEVIKNTSSITHAHQISILGCFIYAIFLLKFIKSNNLYESYQLIKRYNFQKYFDKHTISYYNKILNDNIENYQENEIKSSGFIVHTLESVFWVILNTNNYKDAIIKAINLGEDTDTIGAITGSIAGLIYGFENIPIEWINQLQKLDYIKLIIDKWDNIYN